MRSPTLPAILAAVTAACSGAHEAPPERPPAATARAAPTPPARPPPSDKTNVIFVLSDDQRRDAVACMPKLQKLLERGVEMSNAFVTTPLCCPSRATILTGLYAHHHGVIINGYIEGASDDEGGASDFIKNGNEPRVVARAFGDAGYRTALVGKYLNRYEELMTVRPAYVPPHWDDWYAFAKLSYYDFQLVERRAGEKAKRVCYPSSGGKKGEQDKCRAGADEVRAGAELHSTDLLADKAVAIIESAVSKSKPFFLYFAPFSPHLPAQSPRRYQPDPEKGEFTDEARKRLGACPLYDWKDRPPSYFEADVSDKPEWIRKLKKTGESPEKIDDIRRKQLVAALAVEDAVEKILHKVDELGVADRTVVVYTSDNGYAWGERGYRGKNCAYDECVRVPMIVVDPMRRRLRPVEDALVVNADIAPTLASVAGHGFEHDVPLDGRSFSFNGPLRGQPGTRDEVLIECWAGDKMLVTPTVAGVRTTRWKFLQQYDDRERRRPSTKKGDIELYDLGRDPHEVENLLAVDAKKKGYDPAEISRVTADLRGRLARLIEK